jgi:hypothetical protein
MWRVGEVDDKKKNKVEMVFFVCMFQLIFIFHNIDRSPPPPPPPTKASSSSVIIVDFQL